MTSLLAASMPTPSVEYGLLSPIFIVFGVAVVGVLVEAFLPRRARYGAQVLLALGGLLAAIAAVIVVARQLDPPGRYAVMHALAIDGPTLLLQGAVLLVAVLAVFFFAERQKGDNAVAGPGAATATAHLPAGCPQPDWRPLRRRHLRFQTVRPNTRPSGPAQARPRSSR